MAAKFSTILDHHILKKFKFSNENALEHALHSTSLSNFKKYMSNRRLYNVSKISRIDNKKPYFKNRRIQVK